MKRKNLYIIFAVFTVFLIILGSISVIGTNISKQDAIHFEEKNYKTTISSECDLLPESYYEEVNINGEGPWDPNFSYEYIMYNTEELDESSMGPDDEFDLTIKCLSAWCSPNNLSGRDYWQYNVQFLVWNVGKAYDKQISLSIHLSLIYGDGEEAPDVSISYFSFSKIDSGLLAILGYGGVSYNTQKPKKITIEIKFDNDFQGGNPDVKTIDFDPGVTIYGEIIDKDGNPIYDAFTKCNSDVSFNSLFNSLIWIQPYYNLYFYSLPKNKNKGPFEYTINVENATIRKTVKTEPLGPYDILKKDIVLKAGEAVSESVDLPFLSYFLQKILERFPTIETIYEQIIGRVTEKQQNAIIPIEQEEPVHNEPEEIEEIIDPVEEGTEEITPTPEPEQPVNNEPEEIEEIIDPIEEGTEEIISPSEPEQEQASVEANGPYHAYEENNYKVTFLCTNIVGATWRWDYDNDGEWDTGWKIIPSDHKETHYYTEYLDDNNIDSTSSGSNDLITTQGAADPNSAELIYAKVQIKKGILNTYTDTARVYIYT